MLNDRLLTMLKQLRLSGLTDTLDVRLQEAAGHQLSHAEFLELILQDELLVRNERQIARRVKGAAFRELKALDQFDWSFNPSINRKQVFDLATCRFVREARDVLLLGPPGVGCRWRFERVPLWRFGWACGCVIGGLVSGVLGVAYS
jgi:DNA replication protein DnaC